jgi:hypothetical protein
MARKTVAALFDDFPVAAEAVKRLEKAGLKGIEISIIAGNENDRYSKHAPQSSSRGDDEGSVVAGAVVGGVIGGAVSTLAALALVAIPGIGPGIAAGWLAATLMTGAAGAAVGALAGALIDEGLTEEEAETYAEGVRRGGTLVVVRTPEEHEVDVVQILDQAGAIDIDERLAMWRAGNAGRSHTEPVHR